MTPEEADETQDWKCMDGATAFLLIERHADGWDEIRQMMDAWLRANVAAAVMAEREAQAARHVGGAARRAGAARPQISPHAGTVQASPGHEPRAAGPVRDKPPRNRLSYGGSGNGPGINRMQQGG